MTKQKEGLRAYLKTRKYSAIRRDREAIRKSILKFRESHFRASQHPFLDSFCESFFTDFNPQKAIDFLEQTKRGKSYERQIICTALAAWVISPISKKNIKSAIAISVANILIETEDKVGGRDPHDKSIAEFMIRLGEGRLSAQFFEKIYYPIGGLRTIMEAPEQAPFCLQIKSESSGIEELIRLMDLFHFYNTKIYEVPYFGRFSINIGAGKLHEIDHYPSGLVDVHRAVAGSSDRNSRPKKRRIQEIVSNFRPSIALLYGSAQTVLSSGQTLLQSIANGHIFEVIENEKIEEWFGYSKFVAEKILADHSFIVAEHPSIKEGKYVHLLFPLTEILDFPPPTLSEVDQKVLRDAFRKKGMRASHA